MCRRGGSCKRGAMSAKSNNHTVPDADPKEETFPYDATASSTLIARLTFRTIYLEQPLQAHFPVSQGQFFSFPPQEHFVFSVPATGAISAFGQELQAHSPGAQPQISVFPPQLQVVLFEPETFLTSDLSQLAQAQWPGAHGQASA